MMLIAYIATKMAPPPHPPAPPGDTTLQQHFENDGKVEKNCQVIVQYLLTILLVPTTFVKS
jgi:hypothetical protein